MLIRKTLFITFVILNIAIAKTNETGKSINAVSLGRETISIDGILDEHIWKTIVPISDFIQREPIENVPPTEKTEAYVCYDDEYLYVGIKAYSKDPTTIKSVLTRRDEWSPSDWLIVFIDSYNDNRTAFSFAVNPVGVKRDIRWSNDEEMDMNWNAVWDAWATRLTDGWSAEFKIPFRELRFESAETQSWGFQIKRNIEHNNEEDFWTYWSKDEHGFVSHFGSLNDLRNIPQQKQIQLIPYVNGQVNHSDLYVNPVHDEPYDVLGDLGMDLKVGVTNNLTMDITVNPDFGQVEADPAELNLSAFETYFQEKRPFFIEGGNIFHYPLGIGDGDQSWNSLFYTRRIGRSPHFSAYWGDYSDGYITEPSSTRILGAAKLSGKTSNGLSIGILDAVTAEETAEIRYEDGSKYDQVIEPLTNYFVNRIQKDYREGRTTLGGVLTSVKRKINSEDSHLDWLHTDAYSGGIDFTHLFNDNSYILISGISFSHVAGSADAILNTQLSPNHYFQRPDADHLKLDSSATSLSGHANNLALFKVAGDWRWGFGQWMFSPGFEANDLGYHREVDKQIQFLWFSRMENDPGKYIRSYRSNASIWHGTNFGQEAHPVGANVNVNLTFNNYWRFGSGFEYDGPGVHKTALWGGPAIKTDGRMSSWMHLDSDMRKDISFGLNMNVGKAKMGTTWGGVNTRMNWRPIRNINLAVSVRYHTQDDTWANWSDYGPSYNLITNDEDYLLAHFRQKTFSSTFRVDWTLTPNLSIQYYGSPFITAGVYDDFMKVVDPQGKSYDDRFYQFTEDELNYNEETSAWEIYDTATDQIQYVIPNLDFNYKSFNSNLVLRWEFLPGSTLYAVWSQGKVDYIEEGLFDLSDDMSRLFSETDPENIFLLKVNFLFNL